MASGQVATSGCQACHRERLRQGNLAAWGSTAERQAVGLIGALGANQNKDGVAPKLVSVPPVQGVYLHREQLTEVERAQLRKR